MKRKVFHILVCFLVHCYIFSYDAQSETFIVKDNIKIHGEVLECTPSAIFIKNYNGGAKSILRSSITSVQLNHRGNFLIEGKILDWTSDKGYKILADGRVLTIRNGLVTSYQSLASPTGRQHYKKNDVSPSTPKYKPEKQLPVTKTLPVTM